MVDNSIHPMFNPGSDFSEAALSCRAYGAEAIRQHFLQLRREALLAYVRGSDGSDGDDEWKPDMILDWGFDGKANKIIADALAVEAYSASRSMPVLPVPVPAAAKAEVVRKPLYVAGAAGARLGEWAAEEQYNAMLDLGFSGQGAVARGYSDEANWPKSFRVSWRWGRRFASRYVVTLVVAPPVLEGIFLRLGETQLTERAVAGLSTSEVLGLLHRSLGTTAMLGASPEDQARARGLSLYLGRVPAIVGLTDDNGNFSAEAEFGLPCPNLSAGSVVVSVIGPSRGPCDARS